MSSHKVTIENNQTKDTVRVTSEGALVTTLTSALPVDQDIVIVPFSTYITINGVPYDEGGSNSLTVDGSTTPIDAYLTGNSDGDVYITRANVLISSSGTIALNRFSGIAGGLTNGCLFFYAIPQGERTLGIIKTNFDFIRLGSLTGATGGKTDAYQLSNLDPSNNDGYNPVLDLASTSPLGLGIRIRKNSNDKLGIRIRDNLTGVASFNILLTGYLRLIPDE